MLILKLGGAAITDKHKANTARSDYLRQIAALLAQHRQPLILVHGAGSFGHILAKNYGLAEGYQNPAQIPALAQLQRQLLDLNQAVMAALQEAGLPALAYQPSALCLLESGRIVEFYAEPLRRALTLGLLPVLYGDCVWDRARGFQILSGDQLVVYLANAFQAERAAFGTNVDGVLDSQGLLIPQLSLGDQIGQLESGAADVTGGMAGKLAELATLQTARAQIFNLNRLDQLEAVLTGGGPAGTLIQKPA
jgi:isopentenyl phosphate kinase